MHLEKMWKKCEKTFENPVGKVELWLFSSGLIFWGPVLLQLLCCLYEHISCQWAVGITLSHLTLGSWCHENHEMDWKGRWWKVVGSLQWNAMRCKAVDSSAILYGAAEHNSQGKAGASYMPQLSTRYGHIFSCKNNAILRHTIQLIALGNHSVLLREQSNTNLLCFSLEDDVHLMPCREVCRHAITQCCRT